MNNRERLGSRLGFIMLSAGCAIGCGNVWKFPWMCGQFGGGGFVVVYLLLGLPVMVMEFAAGRAAQTSPIRLFQTLEKPKQKWGFMGGIADRQHCADGLLLRGDRLDVLLLLPLPHRPDR